MESGGMAQKVSFYILQDESLTVRATFACRLAEKAWRNGVKTHIHTATAKDAKSLDSLLWAFREDSFLPHVLCSDSSSYKSSDSNAADETKASQEAVTLSHQVEHLKACTGLLINLGDDIPEKISHFERIAEVVVQESSSLALARERFRQYRERGMNPQHQQVGRPS